MSSSLALVGRLSAELRSARRARGISIQSLAERAGVSARLVSEFERNRRPHVSLETALHLLRLVGVQVALDTDEVSGDVEQLARERRAAERRRTWVGTKTTLREQQPPEPPAGPEARLAAVARVSRLAAALERASSDRVNRSGT
jgi:transcriptional regulator with XRE-family HTH domain